MFESPGTDSLALANADGLAAKTANLLLFLFIAIYVVIVLRTAWINDDAYITFRTIDNFVNGYGLTWNVGERVQAYTHPLWMFILTGGYIFTREAFYTGVVISVLASLAAVVMLSFGLAVSRLGALLGLVILIFSKAFIDYSTSGLENPLTHLLLAVFFLVYFRRDHKTNTVFLLALLTALALLTRLDLLVLFGPALLYAFIQWGREEGRFKRGLLLGFLGFFPLLVWELFSLFYYGSAVPNTAYAKLNNGISRPDLIERGFEYLLSTVNWDPLTLVAIVVGVALPFLSQNRRAVPIAIGILLYVFYLVWIGGDYMTGRFLSAPLFAAVGLLVMYPFASPTAIWPAMAGVILLGFGSAGVTLFSQVNYSIAPDFNSRTNGLIADERGSQYQTNGLLKATEDIDLPAHKWVEEGRSWQLNILPIDRPSLVVEHGAVGMRGYFAGPHVHIIDHYALAEPLLARLPAKWEQPWRIAHFRRTIPDGYLETLYTGQNQLADSNLAAYYDKLSLVIRGELFSVERLREIWKLNTGQYDYLIDRDHYRYPDLLRVEIAQVDKAVLVAQGLESANLLIPTSGIDINLGSRIQARSLELGLDDKEGVHQLIYLQGQHEVAQQTLYSRVPFGRTMVYLVDVPLEAQAVGYDHIRLRPLDEDSYYFAYLLPLNLDNWRQVEDVQFASKMALLGYAYGWPEVQAKSNRSVWTILRWQKLVGEMPDTLKLSLRLVNAEGNIVAAVDRHLLDSTYGQLTNSPHWAQYGLSDSYLLLNLPPEAGPGLYTLTVLVYSDEAQTPLLLGGTETQEIILGKLRVD